MSPLAEAAFGSYDLQVPEGIDIEDIHDFEAPGNELGYVARLSPQRATGIARRFIRADVSVTAKDDTDPDVIPESDVDRVLSEAESRVESEFFLESVITKAGLGASVPYVNFNVGDIVNVRIFDIWVTLPVTRIEPIISEGDVVDWRVHVGGQLLSDDQAREVENATIQKELIQDRRDLAGIDAKATQAKDTADSAKTVADEAKQGTEDNRTYIDEQLDAAGAAVEQGREYLRQMEEHVAAGNAVVGQVGELAGQAAAAADDAVQILNQLDPLRDDVAAIHGDVVDLGREAQELVGAADEAVRQAIEKLAQADGKLQEADQKLQQQINVLEDSQELLANAVKILGGAVAQAAAAAQYAIQSADNAGKAAGEALAASEHNSSAIDAMEDAIDARDGAVEALQESQAENLKRFDELEATQDELTATIQKMQAESLKEKINLWAAGSGTDSNAYWSKESGQVIGNSVQHRYTATGTWRGEVVFTTEYSSRSTDATSHTAHFSVKIPNDDGSRTVLIPNLVSSRSFSSALVQTTIFPGSQTTRKYTLSGQALSQSTWTTLQTITVPSGATGFNSFFRVHWGAAANSRYEIRVTRNNVVVGSTYTVNGLGPLTPLGNGARYMGVRRAVDTSAAGTYRFEVLSNASYASERATSKGLVEASWIMP